MMCDCPHLSFSIKDFPSDEDDDRKQDGGEILPAVHETVVLFDFLFLMFRLERLLHGLVEMADAFLLFFLLDILRGLFFLSF